jgi:hypothetical protein
MVSVTDPYGHILVFLDSTLKVSNYCVMKSHVPAALRPEKGPIIIHYIEECMGPKNLPGRSSLKGIETPSIQAVDRNCTN